MSGIGLIVLAAGASSRMGTPKQLLAAGGKTLIRRAVETALVSECDPITVVLGANAEQIRPELENLAVQIVFNPQWQTGMASSLHAGLASLQKTVPTMEAVVVMLCDQPFLTAAHLNSLIQTYRASNHDLAASSYGGTTGVPALFPARLFPELLALQGEEGARKLLRRHAEALAEVPFPEGLTDLDTPEDWARWAGSERTSGK